MIKDFLNQHIWPWSALHRRNVFIEKLEARVVEADKQISELSLDVTELTGWMATNMVSFKQVLTENDRPIQIAYATGLAKAMVEPSTEKRGAFAHISYITSTPIAYHIRESLDTLKLHNRFTRTALKSDLRRAVANRLIDQSYDLVKTMIFDEDIPE